MPIYYHHSETSPSEVNTHHHLEDTTLLNQFCMANSHDPTTQSHTKENLFKSTCCYDSISSISEVNELLCLVEATS